MRHRTKKVVQFRDHARPRPVDPSLGPNHRALNIVLPVIRIERFDQADPFREAERILGQMTTDLPFLPPPSKPKRERHGVATRHARKAIEKHAMTVEACLTWLEKVAKDNPDPRAVEAFIDEYLDEYCDVAAVLAWLRQFAEVWERRQMRKHKLRTIDEDHPA